MKRRGHLLPQRRIVFVGCEGESERAYVGLLNDIARTQGKALAIQAHLLNPGAGDPHELVKRAVQRLAAKRRLGDRYVHVAVFLDEDQCALAPEKCAAAQALATLHQMQLVWQQADHEAFLLRHLNNCHALRPPHSASLALLQRYWPEYVKPMTIRHLAQRIGVAQLQQARTVETQLHIFLNAIGW